ncbi:MAG: ABC transporter ATP-binding protein [Desulfurococcales archaeon]|nr:ABC transporter ATP-binding protein [Desulfurococcales archaeon]MEB3788999.1 ABC transporter ATP-binding protein [Desulfurococcales archaeon]
MAGNIHISVRDVIKVYESKGEKVTALKGVSMNVYKGEVVAVMGPSGSGKTTLLNLIAGVDKPTAGKIIVAGDDITRFNENQLRLYRLEKIGYVFQQFNLVPTLTALENVLLPMSLRGKRNVARARKLLESVGLGGKENRFPEELSGGEQQRLAIAIALANDPEIIIADEPTGELDISTGEKVVQLLLRESKEHGKTILMTTHDPRVARMANRVILLEDGIIKGEYEPTKISYRVEEGALGEIHAERIIADYLKDRLSGLQRELEILVERFKSGEVSIEELADRYYEIRHLMNALRSELAKLGAGVEAH